MKSVTLNILSAVCVGVAVLLIAIAYFPGYFPAGYERLRQTGLIGVVPLVAASQIAIACVWVYLSNKKESADD